MGGGGRRDKGGKEIAWALLSTVGGRKKGGKNEKEEGEANCFPFRFSGKNPCVMPNALFSTHKRREGGKKGEEGGEFLLYTR